MRKRVMAFLMAVLMIFTMVPSNVVGAAMPGGSSGDGAIYLEVVGHQDWSNPDEITVSVTGASGEAVAEDQIDKSMETGNPNGNILVAITGIEKDDFYTVEIAARDFLSRKMDCEAIEVSVNPAYASVNLTDDTYPDFKFSTNFSAWDILTENPGLAVEGNYENREVVYGSSDSTVAAVDEQTGAVTIRSAGTVSFTATLVIGEDFKKITSDPVILEQRAQSLAFSDQKDTVYAGDEVTTVATVQEGDTQGAIRYEVEAGAAYIEEDPNFSSNGKWIAKSYGDSENGVTVTIKATVAGNVFYKEASKSYTTKIMPYPYEEQVYEIVGKSHAAADGSIWYSSVSKFKARDGYRIKDGGQLKEELAVGSLTLGENERVLTITDEDGKHEGTVRVTFYYDNVAPVTTLTLTDAQGNADQAFQTVGGIAYFDHARKAEVSIDDFSFEQSEAQILVSVDGAAEVNVLQAGVRADGVTVDGNWAQNGNTYTRAIAFAADHVYAVRVVATDKAGNRNQNSYAETFGIDTTAPEGIIAFGQDTSTRRTGILSSSDNRIIYSGDKMSIHVSAKDHESGIESVAYYLQESHTVLSEEELAQITNWETLDGDDGEYDREIDSVDASYIAYVKIADYCGHVKYLSTYKAIVDRQAPKITSVAVVSGTETGWNKDELKLKVQAKDALSGVAKICYSISNSSSEIVTDEEASIVDRAEDGTLTATISIPKEETHRYDAADLKVVIKAVDRSGNTSPEVEKSFQVDTQAPKAQLTLEKQKGDRNYFIFDAKLRIRMQDAVSGLKEVKYISLKDSESKDDIDWSKATEIAFSDDDSTGELEKAFSVSFTDTTEAMNVYVQLTDKAGNVNVISLADSDRFHFDNISPNVELKFGAERPNYSVEDVEYYNQKRTIELCIQEESFDADKVHFMVSVDGAEAVNILKQSVPGVSTTQAFKTEGNVHSMKVSFGFGHTYSINADAEDKAGNTGTALSRPKTFCIGNTIPTGNIRIEEIDNSTRTAILQKWEYKEDIIKTRMIHVTGNCPKSVYGILKVEYWLAGPKAGTNLLTRDELEKIPTWNAVGSFDKNQAMYSYAQDIQVNDDGTYIVYIRFTDYCGNTKYVSTNAFQVEQDPPEFQSVSVEGDADAWHNDAFGIRVSLIDRMSGIDSLQYSVSNGDTVLQDKVDVKLTFEDDQATRAHASIAIPKDPDHKYDSDSLKVTFFATDRVGNASEHTVTLKMDTVDPDAALRVATQPNDKGWYTGAVRFTTEAADATSGINRVEYRIIDGTSGKQVEDGTVDLSKNEIEISDPDKYDSASLKVITVTYDNAGNSKTCEAAVSVDTAAPTADITAEQDSNKAGWYNGKVGLLLTAYDKTSGIDKVEYTIRSESTGEIFVSDVLESSAFKDGKAYTVLPDEAEYNDTLMVETVTYDKAGNKTERSKTVKMDSKAPTAGLTVDTKANQDGWYKGEVTLSVTALDETSGVDYVDYSIGKTGEDSPMETGVLKASDFTDGMTKISLSDDPKYNAQELVITTTAYDIAGNSTRNSVTVKFDTTDPEAHIWLADEMQNGLDPERKVYNRDVQLKIFAADNTAGVKSIRYYVTADKDADADTINWSAADAMTAQQLDSLKKTGAIAITVPENFKNSVEDLDRINVYVQVIDYADNITTVSLMDEAENRDDRFRIDTTKPVIDVNYGSTSDPDAKAYSKINGVEYYNAQRAATVSVKENAVFFDPSLVKVWVKMDDGTEVDINREKLDGVEVTSWSLGEGDQAVHKLGIRFTKDAKYTIRVEAQDIAENATDAFSINKSASFVIDRVNPTGNVKFGHLSAGKDSIWNSAANWKNMMRGEAYEITRFSKGNLTVSGRVADGFSGVKEVSYHISAKDGFYTDVIGNADWTPLKNLGKDGSYTISVNKNNANSVVYLKIVDNSGNVSYMSTNGAIVDTHAPKIDVTLPNVESGVYASDVKVGVSVSDVPSSGIGSGIKKVSYRVTSLGKQTQAGDLYNDTATAKSLGALKKTLASNIVIDADANNSNDVELEVTAVDNAGNVYKTSRTLKIDVTAPVIEVSYNNNSGDTSFADTTYFKDARTATIRVTERNFDESKIRSDIQASNGSRPTISRWSVASGSGNGDNTVHTATIFYGDDADYTFSISAEDVAGNKSGEVDYGNSLAPTKFVVDRTLPVISVAYDNNNAANNNYFKEKRTATVTIQEHNFDTGRISLTMSATNNGSAVAAPTLSGWTNSGDTHTATLTFADDAVYTWSLAYTDKAGNQAKDLDTQNFCVDLTNPVVTIRGINPNSANNTEGNIGFTIECTDTNFGTFTPVLSTVAYENGSFVTRKVDGASTPLGNGEKIEYGNLKEDGVYTLTCSAVDKAGNTYDNVTIINEDGVASTADLHEGDQLIEFSVNRHGSTFTLNDYSKWVVSNYYVQGLTEDFVFIETNADEIVRYSVKLNGETLEEGKDYNVTKSGGNNSWHKYEYAIDKSLFESEGKYNIVIESEDKATSTAYSDLKNAGAEFIVDKTAPTFTISGIEENGNYRGTSQNVTLVPTDDGGKLGHVKVSILDSNGSEVKVVTDLSGDELTEYLASNSGKIVFEVPEGVNQQVAVLCADCAVNEDGETNSYSYTIKGITVSSNSAVLFYENKPLFYSVLGIIAALVIMIPIIIILIKKKKDKEEENAQ